MERRQGKQLLSTSAIVPVAWVVQLGTFSNPANVKRLIEKLRAKGFDAYVKPLTTNGRTLTRVYVGTEIHKEKARVLLEELHDQFRLTGVIKRYQA